MKNIITGIVLIAVSLCLLTMGIRSFLEKGFLLNNAYLFASKAERESMNKKPYYRQSAILFSLIAMTFFLLGFATLLAASWITYLAGVVLLLAFIYAIASSIAIEKKKCI